MGPKEPPRPERDEPPPRGELEQIVGIRLTERSATLLLTTTRPLTRHDQIAIRAAATPLLAELAGRGLIEQP